MKITHLVFSSLLLFSLNVSAQDQMSAFKEAYREYEEVEDAKARAQAKARARAEAQAQAERRRQEAELRAIRQKQEERMDRQFARNQAYEDELRRIELQERRAGAAHTRASASRSNDFIDQQLKRENAHTDVVQSHADANRNLSVGARDMMKGVGQGASKGLPATQNTNTMIIK